MVSVAQQTAEDLSRLPVFCLIMRYIYSLSRAIESDCGVPHLRSSNDEIIVLLVKSASTRTKTSLGANDHIFCPVVNASFDY